MAQMVKNSPAMQEMCVQSLGQGDPLKKEIAVILAWELPRTEWAIVHGVARSQTQLSN